MHWLLTIWLCGGIECAPVAPASLGFASAYDSLRACRHERAVLRREHHELFIRCAVEREPAGP